VIRITYPHLRRPGTARGRRSDSDGAFMMNAITQEIPMSSCGPCKSDSYNVTTTNTAQESATFGARRVEKQSKKIWWDHTVTVEVTYCKPLSEVASAKHANAFLYQGYEDAVTVETAPNKLKIVATRKESTTPPDREQKSMETLMQKRMSEHTFIDNIQVSVASEEKTQVRTFEVWEGVDRMG
jgi:hypothetical protein